MPENETLEDKPKWGGVRANSGRPGGSKNPETIEKEKVLAQVRQRVARSADKLMDSQMNLAQGCQFLFVIETKVIKVDGGKLIEKKEKPRIVTNPETIADYLAGDLDEEEDEYYFMTTQKPDNKALDSLMDRTFGKSSQNVNLNLTDGLTPTEEEKTTTEELLDKVL